MSASSGSEGKLQQAWLRQPAVETASDSQPSVVYVQNKEQLYPLAWEDDPRSMGQRGVFYWEQMKEILTERLSSKTLKEIFSHVRVVPLLCLIDDFSEALDSFLMRMEASQEIPQGQYGTVEETGGSCSLFLEGLELYCLLKQRLLNLKHYWQQILSNALPSCSYKGFVEAHRHDMVKTLGVLVGKMMAALPAGSRYQQLCDKLGLSNKEKEAMHYIFMQNAGVLFAKLHGSYLLPSKDSGSIGGSRATSMAFAAAAFAEMNGREMYEFFDEDRDHLVQELFGPEDEFSSILTSAFLKIPPTVVKACCGSSLSADEFYKVDKTALSEILNAEKRSQASLSQENGGETRPEPREPDVDNEQNRKEDPSPLAEEEGEDEGSGKEEIGLEEILRACDDDVQLPLDVAGDGSAVQTDKSKPLPYCNDLEYLEDNFQLIETLVKARRTETSDDALILRPDQRKPEAVLRELRAKARGLRAKLDQRMEATRAQGVWLPRLERLAELRKLDKFEKNVLLTLTGCMVSQNLRDSNQRDSVFRHHLSIGMLVGLFCEGLEEQIRTRVYFYKNSRLVSEGLVHVSDPPLLSRGNFLDCGVELDRRLLDYIVGLDTEINELVDGSDLYTPDISLSDVALPEDKRELLLNTFESFDKFRKTCREMKISTHGYSRGLCLLFYGPSGTGKTMTANAVSRHLSKKVLLVTVPLLLENQLTKELMRFLFREAKIHNAIIFFDECEPLFESRDQRPNPNLALLLTEIEQYDGIIILATNRQQDLDEAMHRRIQLALPFAIPDHSLRAEIWKSHVPAQLLQAEVNWVQLAQSYELTGGLIRNAVLSAISLASKTSSTDDRVTLDEESLHRGAKLQLRGLLEMIDFERRVIPTFGLDGVVMGEMEHRQIQAFLTAGKTHKFLNTHWGFTQSKGTNVSTAGGSICLLSGDAGSGKTATAHAIAFELGQPIKEANCSELLSHTFTTNVRNKGVAAFFKDAIRANAVVVIDSAEFLLGAVSSGLLSGMIGCETYSLTYHIEHYPGVVILTTRQRSSLLDLSRVPRLQHLVALEMPTSNLRLRLWKMLLPRRVPTASDIDYEHLAERYELNGGQIAAAICSAGEKAATSPLAKITTQLLEEAAREKLGIVHQNTGHLSSLYQ